MTRIICQLQRKCSGEELEEFENGLCEKCAKYVSKKKFVKLPLVMVCGECRKTKLTNPTNWRQKQKDAIQKWSFDTSKCRECHDKERRNIVCTARINCHGDNSEFYTNGTRGKGSRVFCKACHDAIKKDPEIRPETVRCHTCNELKLYGVEHWPERKLTKSNPFECCTRECLSCRAVKSISRARRSSLNYYYRHQKKVAKKNRDRYHEKVEGEKMPTKKPIKPPKVQPQKERKKEEKFIEKFLNEVKHDRFCNWPDFGCSCKASEPLEDILNARF